MTPTLILDIETTGIPGKPPGWEPRVVEIGAVVVTSEGVLADTFERIVWQPREHLEDPRASYAMGMSDLTVDPILNDGFDEAASAIQFAQWAGRMIEKHGVETVQAFNQRFDFGFLLKRPWLLDALDIARGEDIMLAAQGIMGPAGALPQWSNGEYKWPKSSEAAAFFGIEHQGTPHRALPDAKTEALIWLAIMRAREEGR